MTNDNNNGNKNAVDLNSEFSKEFNCIVDEVRSVNGMIKSIQSSILTTPQLTNLDVCEKLETSYYALYDQYQRLARLTLQMSEMYKYVYLVNYANQVHHNNSKNN